MRDRAASHARYRRDHSGLLLHLWLGVSNRGPMTSSGIYQVIVRRGRQSGMEVIVRPPVGTPPGRPAAVRCDRLPRGYRQVLISVAGRAGNR
jgi:hypothetical protein